MAEINPYESPKHASTEAASPAPNRHLQDNTKPGRWRSQDFVFALAQQGVLLGITALILDGGFTFRVCLAAAIAHWVAVTIVVIRRRTSPTMLDVGVLKFGFLFCFVLAFVAPFLISAIRVLP